MRLEIARPDADDIVRLELDDSEGTIDLVAYFGGSAHTLLTVRNEGLDLMTSVDAGFFPLDSKGRIKLVGYEPEAVASDDRLRDMAAALLAIGHIENMRGTLVATGGILGGSEFDKTFVKHLAAIKRALNPTT